MVLSSIATVVNYEYLFYWYLMQDGTIEYEMKLSGELSTNMLSAGEGAKPKNGRAVQLDTCICKHGIRCRRRGVFGL